MFTRLNKWFFFLSVAAFVWLPRADAMVHPMNSPAQVTAAITQALFPEVEQGALIVEDAAGNLWMAEYVGKNPYNGEDVYVLSPLGLDYVTTEGNNVFWMIEKDSFWYNPDVRKILVGTVSGGEVAFNKTFGAGTGSLDLLKKYAEHFWERPGIVFSLAADISGEIAPIQDLTIKDYIQHYVRDYGCATIGEYRGQFQPKTVGEPGKAESFAPVWGSGRQAIYDVQTGHYVWGTVNTVMAASDVFLVKAAATGIAKGAWKTGGVAWSTVRRWMGKTGRAEARQELHHWAIPQGSWGKNVPNVIKNQPWNLMPMESLELHDAIHGWGEMSKAERLMYGTPDWFKALLISESGRVGNELRDQGQNDQE